MLLNAADSYREHRPRVQAQAARFADTAALFQALGGGWWNRADVRPDPSPERMRSTTVARGVARRPR